MGTGEFSGNPPSPIHEKYVMIKMMLISGGEIVDNRKIVLPEKVNDIIFGSAAAWL